MAGIGQAFNRARNAQQPQQPRSGGKFNRPQQGGSGGIADMVRRAQAQKQAAQPSDPRSFPGATTQPVKQMPTDRIAPPPQARNQAYGRMLGARGMPRGRGRF